MVMFIVDVVVTTVLTYGLGKLIQISFADPPTEKELSRRRADAYDSRKPEDRY